MPPQLSALASNLPFLAVLAPLVLFWGQAKDLLNKVIRLFIVEAQVHQAASNAVLYFLRAHGKRVPTNILKYTSGYEYIKKGKINGVKMIAYEGMRELRNQWYWLEGNLITVSDMRGTNKDTNTSVETAVTIRYLRGTVDIERLICRAIEWFESRDALDKVRESPRFQVRRFVGRAQPSDMYAKGVAPATGYSSPQGMDPAREDWKYTRLLNYSISDIGYAKREFFYVFNDAANKVLDDVRHWLGAKQWYQDKGLLFRRGALLHGIPGSGKSSLIRKIGQSLDLPVLSFELATMNDQQFIEYWNEARNYGSCLIVMEDIDTVFNKRQPANANIKLSFECLLNCISGVEPAEGIYLFVTTNRLECLDEALGIPNDKGMSTRPGRLDTCFHMGEITAGEKAAIVKHFLSEHEDIGAALIESSNGCTAAQFSDLCAQKALELYWSKTT